MGICVGDMLRNVFPLTDWHYKRIKDLTLEDALQAYSEGFYCVCADCRIECLTNIDGVVKGGII